MKTAGSVYQRKDSGSWGAVLRINGKVARQESHFGTKTEAKAALKNWENEILNGRYLSREQEEITVKTAIDAHGDELRRKGVKSLSTFDANAKTIVEGPRSKKTGLRDGGLGELPACALTTDAVDRFRDRCLAAGLMPATIDLAVQTLRAALTRAVDAGKLVRVPKVNYFNPNNRRTGFFTRDERNRVVGNLRSVLADLVRLADAMGWRRAEIVERTWDDVDRKAKKITIPDTKNGEPRVVPYYGRPEVEEVIERRWAARQYETASGSAICPFVFHENGRPIGDVRKSWYAACVKAGLGKFVEVTSRTGKKRKKYVGRILHDFRRTAVSDMIDAGLDRFTAKAISGHKTDAVFERYGMKREKGIASGLAKLDQHRAEQEKETPSAEVANFSRGAA